MGNAGSVSKKNQKLQLILTKTGRKKNWQKLLHHADKLLGFPAINAKILAFRSLL